MEDGLFWKKMAYPYDKTWKTFELLYEILNLKEENFFSASKQFTTDDEEIQGHRLYLL